MNILVLHNIEDFRRVRRSTLDYLLSFERYQPEHDYHYLRISHPPPAEVVNADWDAVIIESTALGIVTIRPRNRYLEIRDRWSFLQNPRIVKLVLPQDDANCGGLMDDWFSEWGVQLVFTVRAREHWPVLYPRTVKSAAFHACFSGYIDDRSLETIRTFAKPWSKRQRLIGQRVTMYPARGGRQGQLKGLIADQVKAAAKLRKLKADISTDPGDTFYGDDWYKFLGDCKFVLATEGGLSIHDPYGEISDRIDAHLSSHPAATFDEIEAACFPGLDGQYVFSGFTPRILEAAVLQASQVLVEGHYLGVLKPGEHYLELKPDGSNIGSVLDSLSDHDAARSRIEACNAALVDNPDFRYSALAAKALGAIAEKSPSKQKSARPPDRAQVLSGFIARLAEADRREGFRWPELGRRVAATVVSQQTGAGRERADDLLVGYRAFVQVFQIELEQLSARTEPESPARRFVDTFRKLAAGWIAASSGAGVGAGPDGLFAMAESFADVQIDDSGTLQTPATTAPVLAAFGAEPDVAAFAEAAPAGVLGRNIARFARAASSARLYGLATRLAPSQGDEFSADEVDALQRLDSILIRAAPGRLSDIERLQALAPASTLLLDVLSEGGDAARTLSAFAEARTELLGLLSRLAPAVGFAYSPDETTRLQRLDAVIIRSAAPNFEDLERLQAYAPQSNMLIDVLANGGDPARAFVALAGARTELAGLLNRLAPAAGYTHAPDEIARLQRLDAIIIRSAAPNFEDLERFQAHAPHSNVLMEVLANGADPARALVALAGARTELPSLLSHLAPAAGMGFGTEEILRLRRFDAVLEALERGGDSARTLVALARAGPLVDALCSYLKPQAAFDYTAIELAILARVPAFLSDAEQAEAALEAAAGNAPPGNEPVNRTGFQLVSDVVRAILGDKGPVHSAGYVSGPARPELAKLLYRLTSMRRSEPAEYDALVSSLSDIRGLTSQLSLIRGSRLLIVKTGVKA